MKAIQTRTLLTLGLLIALSSVASAQTNSIAETTAKPAVQHTFPLLETASAIKLRTLKEQENIQYYHGLSSQPWVAVANRNPDASLFWSCGITEADFPLVTMSW